MENNFPNFGKKYKIISVVTEGNCGKQLRQAGYLTYDPEQNRVLIGGSDGKTYQMDFPIYLAVRSQPLARTGIQPTAEKYVTPVTDEELKYINENTTDFIKFGEKRDK